MNRRHLLACALILGAVVTPLFALQTQPQNASQPASQSAAQPGKKQIPTKHSKQPEGEGQRVFEQNCARCHTAPEGFSTRISGTIVRHMRVRANLSQHDEQELLRFFNP
jgi:cytochrome c5